LKIVFVKLLNPPEINNDVDDITKEHQGTTIFPKEVLNSEFPAKLQNVANSQLIESITVEPSVMEDSPTAQKGCQVF